MLLWVTLPILHYFGLFLHIIAPFLLKLRIAFIELCLKFSHFLLPWLPLLGKKVHNLLHLPLHCFKYVGIRKWHQRPSKERALFQDTSSSRVDCMYGITSLLNFPGFFLAQPLLVLLLIFCFVYILAFLIENWGHAWRYETTLWDFLW